MTELSFLIDLLMNHKLPKVTKELIAARIKEVEETYQAPVAQQVRSSAPLRQRAVPAPAAEPVAVVAQTPATAAAMAERQQLINDNINRKFDKEAGAPRKFLNLP